MKTSFSKITILAFSIGVILSACGPQTRIFKKDDLTIPQNYSFTADSSYVKPQSFNIFFKDSILVQLIDSVLANNPDLIIASQRVKQSKASLIAARGALLPSISGGGRVKGTKYGDYTMDGVGNYDTQFSPNVTGDRVLPAPIMGDHFVGLEASWEIDVWGKIRNMKNAEKSRFLASQEGRNLLITNIIATVADLYYELIALDNELRIIQKNIELQNTAVIMIKLQKQGGNVNELAVKQFNAQLLNTQALEFVKTQEIIEVKNQLNFLCGNFDFVKELGENRELINLDNEISLSNVQKTLYNRPDVKMAEMNLKASGYDVKVARALYYPSLSVDAYGGVSSFNTALLLSTPASLAYSLAGGLVAPLFNQNRIKANHKRSIALNREYFQEYRKTVLSSYLEITNLYFKRENIKKIFELKSREVDELKSAVKIANELFNVGYANYLEVVTAQKMVLESELQLIRAQKAINSTLIEIYRATGGGL